LAEQSQYLCKFEVERPRSSMSIVRCLSLEAKFFRPRLGGVEPANKEIG